MFVIMVTQHYHGGASFNRILAGKDAGKPSKFCTLESAKIRVQQIEELHTYSAGVLECRYPTFRVYDELFLPRTLRKAVAANTLPSSLLFRL